MKKLLSLVSYACLLYATHLQATGELLPFQFVNSTNLPASEIYVTIFGFNWPSTSGYTPPTPRQQGFVQVVDGVGTFVNADTSIPSTTYSYLLSSFPAMPGSPGYYQVLMPYLDSGEIFFSIKNPLSLTIAIPALPAPQYPTIGNPIPGNPSDPNYTTIYDKMEFSFEPPDAGSPALNQITVNVTAVDFFSLPIYLTLAGASPASTGITASRDTIMTNLQNTFNSAVTPATQSTWNSLILKNGGSILRVLSAGNGLGYSYPQGPGSPTTSPLYFDPNYLAGSPYSWIGDVWDPFAYYQNPSNVLTVEAVRSETLYYGQVNGSGVFQFWTSPSMTGPADVTLPTPTMTGDTPTLVTFEAIAPWSGSGGSASGDDIYDVGRLVQAGIMTGFLPAANNAVLSKSTLIAAGQSSPPSLYTVNPRLSGAGQASGPWYDLYSAAIFPQGNGAYTWAWDDLVYSSAAPSLALWSADTYVTVQLGPVVAAPPGPGPGPGPSPRPPTPSPGPGPGPRPQPQLASYPYERPHRVPFRVKRAQSHGHFVHKLRITPYHHTHPKSYRLYRNHHLIKRLHAKRHAHTLLLHHVSRHKRYHYKLKAISHHHVGSKPVRHTVRPH